jgi:hypothetical protein
MVNNKELMEMDNREWQRYREIQEMKNDCIIPLVLLLVTIIILIFVVGVSIYMVFGKNV